MSSCHLHFCLPLHLLQILGCHSVSPFDLLLSSLLIKWPAHLLLCLCITLSVHCFFFFNFCGFWMILRLRVYYKHLSRGDWSPPDICCLSILNPFLKFSAIPSPPFPPPHVQKWGYSNTQSWLIRIFIQIFSVNWHLDNCLLGHFWHLDNCLLGHFCPVCPLCIWRRNTWPFQKFKMAPISWGIRDILTNFTPLFMGNQGNWPPNPLFLQIWGHFSCSTPIHGESRTFLTFLRQLA